MPPWKHSAARSCGAGPWSCAAVRRTATASSSQQITPRSHVVRFDAEGQLRPLEIEFDEEHKYAVDRVLDVCRAACQTVGGVGVRYTVRVQGQER